MAATLTEEVILVVDIQEVVDILVADTLVEDILEVEDTLAGIPVDIQAIVDASSALDPFPCPTTLCHTLLLSTVQCHNTDHSTNLLPSHNTAQLPDPFMVRLPLRQFNNISQHLHPHMVPQLRPLRL